MTFDGAGATLSALDGGYLVAFGFYRIDGSFRRIFPGVVYIEMGSKGIGGNNSQPMRPNCRFGLTGYAAHFQPPGKTQSRMIKNAIFRK